MKYLIILLFAIASCGSPGLSESDKAGIKLSIELHNMRNQNDFTVDSIREDAKIDIYFMSKPNSKAYAKIAPDYKKSKLAVFSDEWNKPYDIKRDRFLTFDSYIQYCKSYNYDPKEYSSTLGK